MKPNHFLLLLFLIPGFFFFSCKGPDKKAVEQVTPSAPSITGDFYLIQCSKADFNSLSGGTGAGNNPKGNVVFKYYIDEGKFTLKGWEIKSNNPNFQFDSMPGISFKPTSSNSAIKYGNSTALGDFVLYKEQVSKIKQALIDRGHEFVVFSPKSVQGGTVTWQAGTALNAMSLTTEEPEPVEDADLRPIPPYRYDLSF